MAKNKRMFSNSVVECDKFLEMPDSSQNLYFHLSMVADDDGFVDNWKSVMKMTNKSIDDLKILIAKSFIIPFDSGVIVIKHWRINNYIRNDRYIGTRYKAEKSLLSMDKDLVYQMDTNGIPVVDLDKIRLDKIRLDKSNNNNNDKDISIVEEGDSCDDDLQDIITFYEKNIGLITPYRIGYSRRFFK